MAKLPYVAVPVPTADLNSILRTIEALRINVELLTRQRGDEKAWPPTFDELRRLAVVDQFKQLPDKPDR